MDDAEPPSESLLYAVVATIVLSVLMPSGVDAYNSFVTALHSSDNEFIKPIINIPWWWHCIDGLCNFSAGYILLKFHTWRSVQKALILIWAPVTLLPILVLVFIFNYADAATFDNVKFESEIIRSGLAIWVHEATRSSFFNVLYTCYFLNSKRVRNTYPRL